MLARATKVPCHRMRVNVLPHVKIFVTKLIWGIGNSPLISAMYISMIYLKTQAKIIRQ